MADAEEFEDGPEDTHLEAAADAPDAAQPEAQWGWRKAAALASWGRAPPPAPPPAEAAARAPPANVWRLTKAAKAFKAVHKVVPADYPPLDAEALKDPEDPDRIYWDMAFVFPVPKEAKTAEDFVAKAARAVKKRFKTKQRHFDHAMFIGEATAAGLVTSSYLSIQKDEIYVRVGATHRRLCIQADNVNFPTPLDEARLRKVAEAGLPQYAIEPMRIPNETPAEDGARTFSRFRAYQHINGKYDNSAELAPLYRRTHEHTGFRGDNEQERTLFNSMRRLKLLWSCLNEPPSCGGAGVAVEKFVARGKILAALAMHDPRERKALYEHWVHAPYFSLPNALPLEAYKEYFGEKQGLLMAFKAHITTGYLVMAVFGIAVMLWWGFTGDATGDGSVALYAGFVALWSVLNTESWRRKERELALKWGMVGFEAQQSRRPQFKGIQGMDDAVTGRPGAFFPPHRRAARVSLGVVIGSLCVALCLLFLALCVVYKATPGNATMGTVVNSVGIILFKVGYEKVAVLLTDAENWMTDTVYADKLVCKLTAFNFINSYFSLFFTIFGYCAFWGNHGDLQMCRMGAFRKLQQDLGILLAIQIFASNLTSFLLPYLQLVKNMREQGGLDAAGLVQDMSRPGVEFLLVECDEQLDNIKATSMEATQYGYVTLFSAAFPGAPFMTCINNLVGLRTDGYKYLCTYRRIQPFGFEDIGTFQAIFELMNYAGVVNSFLAIVYRTDVVDNYWPGKWGANGPSRHQQDIVFMVVVVFFFAVTVALRVLIDDMPFDVALQIKRNDFLNSKIIDHVADEADPALSPTALATEVRIHDRDTMEPYSTYDKLFGRGGAVRPGDEITPRHLRPLAPST